MKKAVALLSTLAILLCMFSVMTFAADQSVTVYVTISNGTTVLPQDAIIVTDSDKDGVLTINDALFFAHEAKFDGGATAGYASSKGDYGLSINKLWGAENGSGYGYYINNKSAMGLADPIKDGDYINAFVYTDTTSFSDIYCYFNTNTVTVSSEPITLILSAAAYDENFNPIVIPVEGATITIDGAPTDFKTDANGSVTLSLDAKNSVISAKSDSSVLVPPLCLASANVTSPQTNDNSITIIFVILSAISLAGFVIVRRTQVYEK